MNMQAHDDPKIVAAAERQMRDWAMTAAIQDRGLRMKGLQQLASQLHRYLAISRESATGGSAIAKIVGQRLGWEVLDKELLDRIAQRYHSNRSMLDLVDETPSNWVYDVLGTWMDSKVIPHETYVIQLSRVVLAATKHSNVVFVGRGAQFLLPRDKGFIVRLVAPEQFRLDNLMRQKNLTLAEAKRFMHEAEQGRREFVRRFFHHDVTDPHLYDLVINTQRLGVEGSAEVILSAMVHHFNEQTKEQTVSVESKPHYAVR